MPAVTCRQRSHQHAIKQACDIAQLLEVVALAMRFTTMGAHDLIHCGRPRASPGDVQRLALAVCLCQELRIAVAEYQQTYLHIVTVFRWWWWHVCTAQPRFFPDVIQ